MECWNGGFKKQRGIWNDICSQIRAEDSTGCEGIRWRQNIADMAHPVKRGEAYRIVFGDEDRLTGVAITGAVFGPGGSVTFDAVGSPSDGGTVTLSLGGR